MRLLGTWGVKARKVLGLKGEVERKDFVALVSNRRPGANGKRLNARMNKTRLEDVKDKKTGLPVIHGTTSRQRTLRHAVSAAEPD